MGDLGEPVRQSAGRRAASRVAVGGVLLTVVWCGVASAQEGRRLSRVEAMRLAVERNLALLSEGLDRDGALLGAEASSRPFVPVVYAAASYEDRAPFDVKVDRQRTIGYGGGLRWQTTLGTSLDASVQADDRLVPGGGRSQASVELGATQPLLRDAGRAGSARVVVEAELEVEVAREAYRAQLNRFLLEVERAYQELAFAQADLEIKARSRDRAQQQYEDTRENIRRGLLAEAEVYVVEENVVIFEQFMVSARENLAVARQNLARLLQLSPDEALVATDAVEVPEGGVPAASDAVERALLTNPELAVARLQTEVSEVSLAFEENQRLPTLDVSGTLRLNGIGASPGPAWQEVAGAGRPEWGVGVTFELPLDRDPDRARVERAALERQSRVMALKDVEQEVVFDVRQRLVQLENQLARLGLAERRRELAGLKLEAEQDKYRNGIATLADVVRFQRELDTANIEIRRLQVTLWVTRAQLLVAQGTLHTSVGLEVR